MVQTDEIYGAKTISNERENKGKHERVTMVESVFVRQNLDRYMYYFHFYTNLLCKRTSWLLLGYIVTKLCCYLNSSHKVGSKSKRQTKHS